MRVSIFGLGYVGCVSAACLARNGNDVIGVDVNSLKVELINQGASPIVEPGISQLISAAVSQKRLRATSDSLAAVKESDITLVCVGTPGASNGKLDLTYITRASRQI